MVAAGPLSPEAPASGPPAVARAPARPTGQAPAGQAPAGQASAGQASAGQAPAGPAPRAAGGGRRWRQTLALLFPDRPGEPPLRPRRADRAHRAQRSWPTWAAVPLTAASVVAGTCLLLARQSGTPSWRTLWGEDGSLFLPEAMTHPVRSLLWPYAGYLQTVPRLIADEVALLPLATAAAVFAITGALAAAGCAAFVYYASAGHIHRPWLRALLATGVLLLPAAVVEVANSGVDVPWYLMFATFWALLWRPRARAAQVLAFAVCFAAASSQVVTILLAPLALARVLALRRPADHAATAGWLSGMALQLVFVVPAAELRRLGPVPAALRFYAQHVLLAAVAGRHLADELASAAGPAVAITAGVCAVVAAASWMLARGGKRVRLFTITCLALGLMLTVIPAVIRGWVTTPVPAFAVWVPGTRYATVPVLLLYSAAIVAVDAYLSQRGPHARRVPRQLAVGLLLAVLLVPWAADFRAANLRSPDQPWPQTISRLAAGCPHTPGGSAWVPLLHRRVRCSGLG